MHFGFEVPSSFRSCPDRCIKTISLIGPENFASPDKSICDGEPMVYYDLLHFLKFLPKDATTNDFSKVKGSKGVFTIKIFLNSEKNQKIMVKIDQSTLDKRGEGKAYLSYVVSSKNKIDLAYFDKTSCPKKDLYVFKTFNNDEYNVHHPFRKIGKFLKSQNILFQTFQDNELYSDSYHRKNSAQFFEIDDPEFWHDLKGHKKFIFNSVLTQGVKVNNSYLQGFIFLHPNYKEIIQKCNYIELDASFSLSPYVYCIPLGIINNESFPLGITIGPSENFLLYSQFYEFVKQLDNDIYQFLITKPVLSDEGGAIEKFCNQYHISLHFYCFRHLIQKFGSSTKIGDLVKKLLFMPTHEAFLSFWQTQNETIVSILSTSSKQNIERFQNLFLCKYDKTSRELSEPDFFDQSLWMRAKYGVASCSNHIESIHQKINMYTTNIRLFSSKLHIILNYIFERFTKALKRPNLKFAIFQSKKVFEKYNLIKTDHDSCQISSFKSALYGVEYPCPHTIEEFVIEPFEKLSAEETEFRNEIENNIITYKEWVFHEKHLHSFNLTTEDQVFLGKYGFPERKKFVKIAKQCIINADVDDDFIINLFIHFCRMKYQTGYYYISDPIFYQFVLEQINTPWHAEQFLFDKLQLQFQKPINYKIPSKITKLTQKEINEIGEPDYIEEEEEREREYPNSEEKAVLIEEKKIKGLAALKEEHEELIDLLNN